MARVADDTFDFDLTSVMDLFKGSIDNKSTLVQVMAWYMYEMPGPSELIHEDDNFLVYCYMYGTLYFLCFAHGALNHFSFIMLSYQYRYSHYDRLIFYVELLCWEPGGHLNIKISSYQYRDPHAKDKTVSQPSYL